MYDFKPKFSQKLNSNNSLHHPSNSLPKLTITADDSPEKINSTNPRKLTTKSHNFLQLFSLHKSYLCSTKVKTNRNMEKSPTSLRIGARSVKNKNCGKNINVNKNNESQLKCRDKREDDLEFCKQKLKQFKQQVVIVRDRLMLESNLRLRLKTDVQQTHRFKEYGYSSIQKPDQESNLLNIKSSKIELKIGNFVGRRSRLSEKLRLSKIYPQSLVLKKKKPVAKDELSPWDSIYPDVLNTQI